MDVKTEHIIACFTKGNIPSQYILSTRQFNTYHQPHYQSTLLTLPTNIPTYIHNSLPPLGGFALTSLEVSIYPYYLPNKTPNQHPSHNLSPSPHTLSTSPGGFSLTSLEVIWIDGQSTFVAVNDLGNNGPNGAVDSNNNNNNNNSSSNNSNNSSSNSSSGSNSNNNSNSSSNSSSSNSNNNSNSDNSNSSPLTAETVIARMVLPEGE